MQAQRPGEIVFIGAARIPSEEAARLDAAREFSLHPDRRSYRTRRLAKSQRASRHGRSRYLGGLHRREELWRHARSVPVIVISADRLWQLTASS